MLVEEPVVDLRLRNQPRQLATHRHDRFVAEQSAGPVSGRIHQGLLLEPSEFLGGVELRDLDVTAARKELIEQRLCVGGKIEHHLRISAQIASAELMAARDE